MLTAIAECLKIELVRQRIQRQVVLKAVEVRRAMELVSLQPANEQCHAKFLSVVERQLLRCRTLVMGVELPEVGHPLDKQRFVNGKGLLRFACSQNDSLHRL